MMYQVALKEVGGVQSGIYGNQWPQRRGVLNKVPSVLKEVGISSDRLSTKLMRYQVV